MESETISSLQNYSVLSLLLEPDLQENKFLNFFLANKISY